MSKSYERLAYLTLFGNVSVEVNVACTPKNTDEEIKELAIREILRNMGSEADKALVQTVGNKRNWDVDFPKGRGYRQ